ncbi:hypothetical protein NDU88_011731 [Pleurodeles waltl]|uniref:Uncharacterized protein n=1 Tax=Pleurodeles waltl TaxID=8319 RepID=A0AAV7S2N8_PLEWA|nr:hypothetical protein NDU88_011731 [Pleurodeles waltl]
MGGPNQAPTRGPEASLQARKPLPGSAGPHPRLCATQQGQRTKPREDKAQARVSHPGSCHGPAGAPEHKPAGYACALSQCTPRPSRVRQAGGWEYPLQALGRQLALWEARFGGATHRTGLQGGSTPGPPGRGGLAQALAVPSPGTTGPQEGPE